MPYFKNSRNTRNVDIYYEVISEKISRFPLIFVHGYGNSLNMFHHQIQLLKPYFQLILIDAEGHGKTKKTPANFTDNLLTNTIQDLEDLLIFLNINSNLGFICHSLLGSSIAIEFSVKYSDRIEFLIFLNGGNLSLDTTIRNIFWNLLPQYTRMNFHEIIRANKAILIEKTVPFIKNALLPMNPGAEIESRMDILITKDLEAMVTKRVFVDEIICKTLIIGAELDNYAPLYLSKELDKQLKNSQLSIVGMTGHFGLSQRYQEYNKIILKFITENNFLNQNRSEYERESIEPARINGF